MKMMTHPHAATRFLWLAFVLGIVVCSPVASAQTDTGSLDGTVSDFSRLALSGARVSIDGTNLETVTARNGDFYFDSVPAGARRVRVSYLGYDPETFDVAVVAGQRSTLDARLGGDVVTLDIFRVEGARADQARAFTDLRAATNLRVRVDLFDSTQSISVITREFMDDIGARRPLDAAKYVSSITESFIPNGLDFLNIRGFQTRGQTVDGFYSDAQINQDSFIIDRFEIAKGPNAVLSPAGIPGGTINLVSKKPEFIDFGNVSLATTRFGGYRTEFDYNHVFNQRLAVRVLLAGEDSEDYVDSHAQNWLVTPMFTYRFSLETQITLQFLAREAELQNYMGLPIDPSSGTTNTAKILSGIDRFLNIYEDDFRWETRNEGRLLFTSNLSESFSMRLAGRYTKYEATFTQNNPTPVGGAGATGGSFDPHTGLYVPGVIFGPAPAFTASAAPPQSRSFTRTGRFNPFLLNKHLDVQNDYVYLLKNDWVDSTTGAGWAYSYFERDHNNFVTVKPIFNIDTHSGISRHTVGARTLAQYSEIDRKHVYVSETAKFFKDRLVLSGSYTWDWHVLRVRDYRLTPATNFFANPSAEQISYGILVKPIPTVALFHSYAEQGTPLAAASIAAGHGPLQQGTQNEYGARAAFFDKKLMVTVAYFDITQTNNPVSDPRNAQTPAPVPLFPPILTDRYSKGWEFEFSGSLTDNILVIGNYTNFKNRDIRYDLPARANADQSAAIWVRYDFKEFEALKGLAVGVGANYLGKRPGDVATGFARASTPDKLIPNQPSFYIPARTLVDMNLVYKYSPHWSAQLNVDNVFNAEYLAGAENRFIVWVGAPTNVTLKITRAF